MRAPALALLLLAIPLAGCTDGYRGYFFNVYAQVDASRRAVEEVVDRRAVWTNTSSPTSAALVRDHREALEAQDRGLAASQPPGGWRPAVDKLREAVARFVAAFDEAARCVEAGAEEPCQAYAEGERLAVEALARAAALAPEGP